MANVRGSGVRNRNRLKPKTDEPKKYLTTGRGSRVLNPKWTAWNKAKTDKEDLAARKKENEAEARKYVREEKSDGTVTVRKRTAVDSLSDIQKYSSKPDNSNKRTDYYTGKKEKTTSDYADDAAKSSTVLKINKKENGNGSSSSKSKSKSKKEAIMIGGKRATAIQKKLIAGGWTVKELEAKQKKHREWKKNRGK